MLRLVQSLSLPHLSSKTVVRMDGQPQGGLSMGWVKKRAWSGSEGIQRGVNLWKLTENTAPKDRSGRNDMHVVN